MRFPEEPVASIFITRFVQVFIALLLFLGLLFRIDDLTQFCLLLLIIGTGTYLWSRISFNGVDCSIAADRTRLFPGEDINLTIRTVNSKLLPVILKIKLPLDNSFAGTGEDGIFEEFGLLWYQRKKTQKKLTPLKRGVYNLGPPYLQSGDIFGFFKREKDGIGNHEIIVFPRIIDLKPADLPRRDFFGIPGTRSPVEDPVYIYGTREYQPGSPARRIHWKASARHNRLQEKLCEPAEQEKVLSVLDVSAFAQENASEDFEHILETTASLILQYYRRGYSIGFATNGIISGKCPRIIPISRNPGNISLMLELLARLHPDEEAALRDILIHGYKLPWGVSCLHLSYNKNEYTRSNEAFFRQRNIPVRFIYAKNDNIPGNGNNSGHTESCGHGIPSADGINK